MPNKNNWNFSSYMGGPQTAIRSYQQYAPGPYDFPRNQHIPNSQRPPLQTVQLPYADPFKQTLPRAPTTPGGATPRWAGQDMFQPGYYDNKVCELGNGYREHEHNAHLYEHEHECDMCVDKRGCEHNPHIAPNTEMRCIPINNVRGVTIDNARDVASTDDGGNTKKCEGTQKKADGEKKNKKKKGAGSKSGEANQRTPGVSDDKIKVLGEKDSKAAAVTPAAGAWTNAEQLEMVKYITGEKVWPNFKVNQASVYLFMSKSSISLQNSLLT